MELEKHIIHNYVTKKLADMQITINEDFNVPDMKPDIENILSKKCNVHIDSVKAAEEKAEVRGKLQYALLYAGDEPASMQGTIDFDEAVNIPMISEDAKLNCEAVVEDLNVRAVNSRKINVRAVVLLKLGSERYEDVSIPYECTGECRMEVQKREVEYAQLAVNATDSLRVRTTFELPQNKPAMTEIIWSDINMCSVSAQMTDEGLQTETQVTLLVLYRTADNEVIWHEAEGTVSNTVDVSGSSPELVCFIQMNPESCSVEIRPDFDGEDRVIEVDAVSSICIRAYEEKKQEMIEDCYMPVQDTELISENVILCQLLTHNNARYRTQGMIKADERNIQQICGCTGKVRVEDLSYEDNVIEINGVIDVSVLYLKQENALIWESAQGAVAFRQRVEVRKMAEFCGTRNPQEALTVTLSPAVERITASVSMGTGIEIKAVINIDLMVLGKCDTRIIDKVIENGIDEAGYVALPQMTGYIAKDNDTLWNIAKGHHTTVESIKRCNKLSKDNVAKGDRLILVKSAI